MKIHSRKMNVSTDVDFEELARCTEDFNGAQCKAVCVEAVRRREREKGLLSDNEIFVSLKPL